MKKYWSIGITILLFGPVYCQGSFTDFQAGFLFPSNAKTGFIGGIQAGRMVDNAIGYGIELDVYRKKYVEDRRIALGTQGGAEVDSTIREVDNTVIMLPLLFKLNYSHSLNQKLTIGLSGGIGYEVLWNSVNKPSEGIDDTKFYHGFAWMIGGKVSTPLSKASNIFFEINYHNSEPSRSEDKTPEGADIRKSINMSGIMLRLGIRIFTIGL